MSRAVRRATRRPVASTGRRPRTSFGQNDSDKIGCAAADRIGRYAGSPDGCGYWVIDNRAVPYTDRRQCDRATGALLGACSRKALAVTFSGGSLVLGWNLFRVGILSDQQAQLRAYPEASGPRHPREGAGRAPALSSGALAP